LRVVQQIALGFAPVFSGGDQAVRLSCAHVSFRGQSCAPFQSGHIDWGIVNEPVNEPVYVKRGTEPVYVKRGTDVGLGAALRAHNSCNSHVVHGGAAMPCVMVI
jgi:hypothetical protein